MALRSRSRSIPRLLWTRGRLFPRPRERRQIISHISRASNDHFLFLPAPLHGVALFRIIIPALLDKIFRPMPLSTERRKRYIRLAAFVPPIQRYSSLPYNTRTKDSTPRMRHHDCPILRWQIYRGKSYLQPLTKGCQWPIPTRFQPSFHLTSHFPSVSSLWRRVNVNAWKFSTRLTRTWCDYK